MINPAIIELLQAHNAAQTETRSSKRQKMLLASLGKPMLLLSNIYADSIGLTKTNNSLNKREKGALNTVNSLLKGGFSAYELKTLIQSIFSKSVDLDIIDSEHEEDANLCWDLNYPIPYSWHQRYDLVIDSGTNAHVFNIGTSLLSTAQLPREGGLLVGALPFYSPNHGFYNINANCLAELFCPTNGYQLLALNIHGYTSPWHSLQGESLNRFVLTEYLGESRTYDEFLAKVQATQISPKKLDIFNTLYYAAQRHTILPITPPQQRKYKYST